MACKSKKRLLISPTGLHASAIGPRRLWVERLSRQAHIFPGTFLPSWLMKFPPIPASRHQQNEKDRRKIRLPRWRYFSVDTAPTAPYSRARLSSIHRRCQSARRSVGSHSTSSFKTRWGKRSKKISYLFRVGSSSAIITTSFPQLPGAS